MSKNLKIKLTADEIKSLLMMFTHFNPIWIVERNRRCMVNYLLGKIQVKLIAKHADGQAHEFSFNNATAAAFDEAFRLTPIPMEALWPAGVYESNLINGILGKINKML